MKRRLINGEVQEHEQKFGDHETIKLYTDGSLDENGIMGSGVIVCDDLGRYIDTIYVKPTASNPSSTKAELQAILTGLERVNSNC